jgi:hypothetical protein
MELRAVIPVAERIDAETWLVSVEIYDSHMVVRWAASGRSIAATRDVGHPSVESQFLVLDDGLGTEYEEVGAFSGGGESRYTGEWEIAPAPPARATTLRLSISDLYETTISLP